MQWIIKPKQMLWMQYFCSASTGEEKLAILLKYVCACTNSLLSLCKQHGRKLISHSNISVGNGKTAETHAEHIPFSSLCHRRRKHWNRWWGNKWHFLHMVIPLYLQIDALSEIDRRMGNECILQWHKEMPRRHCGISVLSILTGWLFKAQRGSCLCYSDLEGSENMCNYLLWDNSLNKNMYFISKVLFMYFGELKLPSKVFSTTLLEFFFIYSQKELNEFHFPVYSRCLLHITTESFVLYEKSCTGRRPC